MSIRELLVLSDADFVLQAFELLLGRLPDANGVNHYINRMHQGEGKLSVLADIVSSPESESWLAEGSSLSVAEKKNISRLAKLERRVKSPFGFIWAAKYARARFNMLEMELSSRFAAAARVVAGHQQTSAGNINAQVASASSLAGKIVFAVRITGGLGDAVIIARYVRDLLAHIEADAEFDVYFHSPHAIKVFFSRLPGFRAALHDELLHQVVMHYDFAVLANQYVTFANEHIKFERLIRLAPRALEVFSTIQDRRKDMEKYIQNHPNLDGAFADLAVRNGHSRYRYLHYMSGLAYGGSLAEVDLRSGVAVAPDLYGKKYITIHDGWDTKYKSKASFNRPTKALPQDLWAELVSGLKARLPDYILVQIGGKTGADLPGIDINLRNKLSLEQSLSVLGGAALHVDAESGLVHMAASLGVRSVVMFGPTNVDWFAYPENVNIKPPQCGNCWWSVDTWMERCPAEHETPVCMSAHVPRRIVEVVVREMEKNSPARDATKSSQEVRN